MIKEAERPELPEAFLTKMRGLLGQEYELFLESYGREKAQGLRINPLKAGDEEAVRRLEARFGLRPVPWAREGYYFDKSLRPGKHVFHDGGVFYIQEPSAMAAVELLDPRPGERILDLCAAPGGKTTQIGGRLMGKGFLLSNEYHPARAKILSQNVERMGIANAVVTNQEAGALAQRFPCFFDKVLVDAPCSGEGMFRKDPEARAQWSLENVDMCAARQGEILSKAAAMTRPGGRLVYSTCTFSPEENEGSVHSFLRQNPEFSVERVEGGRALSPGRPQWILGGGEELSSTFRIWPHMAEGEGHFVAVLKKDPDALDLSFRKNVPSYVRDRQVRGSWKKFAEEAFTKKGLEIFDQDMEDHMVLFGEQLYWIPKDMPDYQGLRVLRAGLRLGSLKKNRFEPSHSLALYLKKDQVNRWEAREARSPELEAYLRGETLKSESRRDGGWVLMLAEDYSLGWAKQVGETLKNHYPKGLRRLC